MSLAQRASWTLSKTRFLGGVPFCCPFDFCEPVVPVLMSQFPWRKTLL